MSFARPLLDNPHDLAAFVERDSTLTRTERAIALGANVAVVGPRGAGKTSLLRMLQYRQREAGRPVLFVNGRRTEDLPGLLATVLEALPAPEGVPAPDRWRRDGGHDRDRDRDHDHDHDELALIDGLVRAAGGAGSPLVICDEVPSPETGHALFGRLRDELWRVDATWAVGLRDDWAAAVLEPPADAFFDAIVAIGPLTDSEIRQLLNARLPQRPAARIWAAIRDSRLRRPATPRDLFRLAQRAAEQGLDELVEGAGGPDPMSTLGRPEAMLVTELRHTGPVSASDEGLLRRLGWTRPRAVQVLRQLEGMGAVVGREAPNPKGGRPLKRYELTEPWA